MNIMMCTFKRTEKSESEKGIIIDEGHGPIVDSRGKVVYTIWNYTTLPYQFCVNLELKEK